MARVNNPIILLVSILALSCTREVRMDLPEGVSLWGGRIKDGSAMPYAAGFRADGKLPPKEFYRCPQYNTWIELMYNQNQEGVLEYARGILANGLPAAGLYRYAGNDTPIYVIDPKPVPIHDSRVTMIPEVATVGMQKFVEML